MPTPDIPPLNGHFLSGYDDPRLARARRPRSRLNLQATAPTHVLPELILGAGRLLPFHFLRTGDRRGRAVVKICRSDGACGTGFLVAPDVLLTNHHVLPDIATASGAVAVANHEADPPDGVVAAVAIKVQLAPKRLFVTQEELDFTFCGVLGLEGLGVIPMTRDSQTIGTSDVVNIIQHPRGRPKEVAIQDNHIVKADHVVLHYICDTEPGSSGSPVFDNRWRLVALHHASIVADAPAGGRHARGMDRQLRFLNEGVRLSAIALSLEASDAATGAGREALDRLRGLFRDLDPRAGFFGALGRSLRGRSAAEVGAEVDKRGGETLDVGFWDLRTAAPRLLNRIDDLGWAMAAMGMDLWCLSHLSPARARALVEHLDTNFRLEYRLLPPFASLAVLVRKSRFISAERIEETGLESVRVRIRDPRRGLATIRVLPIPGRGPSVVRDLVGAIVAARPGKVSADWLLIGGPSARVGDADREAMLASGLDLATAEAGLDGGLVLLRGATPTVTGLLASPNLAVHDDAMTVVRDRRLPDTARHLTTRRPIAARLLLIRDADPPVCPT
ncbi:MAG: putative N-acetylmuramoyl-L-alanine amidase [Planctomycetota bacterium]|nr:putative N-acetylmuramoyl-L-alanine amidase [Planctomycetota bacterium]